MDTARANEVVLKVENVSLTFGGLTALDNVSFEARQGEILAIIGPNGAGKTCILNSICGFYRPQSGDIYFRGQRLTRFPPYKISSLGISRTFQSIELYTGLSTIDNLMAARHIRMKSNILSQVLYFGWAHKEELKQRAIVENTIDFLEIQPLRKRIVGTLPYGMRKRVDLGRALVQEPELLLLDEPMAGMNLEEKEDMARFILDIQEEQGTTVVMVEHDMGLVMDICDRVLVLDFGSRIAEGTPKAISCNERVIEAYLGTAAKKSPKGG